MKKSDLKEGEEYAYSTRRDPYYATRVRLLHIDQLYETTRDSRNGPVTGFKPAPSHITRPKAATLGWNSNSYGYPVEDVQTGRKFVVDTRNLLSTWEDWLVHREQKQVQERDASERRIAAQAQHEQDVQTIRTLLKERWAPGGVHRFQLLLRHRDAPQVRPDLSVVFFPYP